MKFYIFLSIGEYVCAVGIHCIIILWNGVVYVDDDHFCYVSFANLRAVMWAAVFVYLFPCLCVLTIYIRITIFLRHQTKNLLLIIKQRQERDFLIIQRILVMIILLIILGMPAMFFIIRFGITNDYHPLTLRVSWLPVGISMAGLSFALLFCIPQLKNIIRNCFRQNQIAANGVTGLPETLQA